MCLNQGALSCSGTHFIKPSSWGRGSMHPHIYHTNPSGLSPFFTDSMCVIGSRPPDQTTHWLPTLIHFHFHLPFSVLRFLICALPLPPWVFLWCSPFLSRSSLSFISLFVLFFCLFSFFKGGRCCPALMVSEPCCFFSVWFHSLMCHPSLSPGGVRDSDLLPQ